MKRLSLLLIVLAAFAAVTEAQSVGCKGLMPMGNWQAGTVYPSCAIVRYQTCSYLSRVTSIQAPAPPSWMTLACDGQNGQAATIAVGQVSTLPPGSQATVSNDGDPQNAVFSFGIPRGDSGLDGVAATVNVGKVSTLPAGTPATVSNSGTPRDAVLDFGIPQGPAGPNYSWLTYTINPDGTVSAVINGSVSAKQIVNSGPGVGAIQLNGGFIGIVNGKFVCVTPSGGSCM